MRIGVAKEIKPQEYRVALTPAGARELVLRGHDVVVARLLRVAWWDWPQAVVEGAHRWFTRPVAEFLDHFDPGSVAGDAWFPTPVATVCGAILLSVPF